MRNWFRKQMRRRRWRRDAKRSAELTREFVYLDEVSVFSLLASKDGMIATEVTDMHASTLMAETAGSYGASGGVIRADASARAQASDTRTTQVLRKAIVQSTFRDLYQRVRDTLVIAPAPADDRAPHFGADDDLKPDGSRTWILDPSDFRRGQLIELTVELEAEPLFQARTVVSTFLDIFEQDQALLGMANVAELADAAVLSRMIEKLGAGLVPLRAKARDYVVVTKADGTELIAHRDVVANLGPTVETAPLYLVGVATETLFWKDIRTVVFARSEFQVLVLPRFNYKRVIYFSCPSTRRSVMWKVPPLEISAEDRRELERLVRAHTTPQRQVRRARVVLLAAEGVPNRRIAAEVGMSEHNVGKWRHRFAVSGLAGLKDAPRPGRPPLYGHEERLRLVAKVTEEPPDPASHWSHSQLAVALSDIGISASQVGRILASLDIKPHRVRSWISRRNDPDFWERAADVCGLYVNPPENALVLSVDEKTAIPARNPTQPTEPVAPGQVERKESEYVRHGVAHLVAALDVHRGGIFHATDVSSNNSTNFCSFLADVDAKVPAELEIHLVLDNGSSHVSKETRAWLEQHPRFHVHHTPNHASWLNMVELFFSILARRLLKRGEFTSVDDLVRKIMAFIEEYNRTAKPFRWTYGGKPLKVA